MDIILAKLMLKFIEKVCSKHSGLCIVKYSKLSGVPAEKAYRLEWSNR
jgi:hypothetical protein